MGFYFAGNGLTQAADGELQSLLVHFPIDSQPIRERCGTAAFAEQKAKLASGKSKVIL